MPPKKPSGAQFKKIREQKIENIKKNITPIDIFLKKSSTPLVHSSLTTELNLPSTSSHVSCEIETEEKSTIEHQNQEIEKQCTCNDDNYMVDVKLENIDNNAKIIDFNDPTTWHLTNSNIQIFVQHGPELCDNLSVYPDRENRHFDKKWFVKTMSNGEQVLRNWLIYCKRKDALFCFPCIIFGKNQNVWTTAGFRDWQHLNPMLPRHENSLYHKKSYVEWKTFESKIKKGGFIDDQLQEEILKEKEKWRHILKVILDAILHCVKNNDALRGTCEKIGHPECGKFLNTIELISHYDPIIAQHIESHKKNQVNYFSPIIQNDIINIVASKIRQHIISNIQKAKYFSILFDSTPDTSHQEQMTQILRYVNIDPNTNKCSIEETFIDFIVTHEKTGEALANDIENKLTLDGLNIRNIRGQSYDNGANMAGKYKGVQARILRFNNMARFVPCTAHSLNLIGVHAAQTSVQMKSCFETIQQLFNFFVNSTSRWDLLKEKLSVRLKGLSDTRWSAKANAVKALRNQLPLIIELLNEMCDGQRQVTVDSVTNARMLLKLLTKFKFVALLIFWDTILGKINKVNLLLQERKTTVENAAKMINALKNEIQQYRNDFFDSLHNSAKSLAETTNIETYIPEKRRRKIKNMPGEKATDDSFAMNESALLKKEMCEVLDIILIQLNDRFTALQEVANDFSFLNGHALKIMPLDDLKRCATDLALKYNSDLDAPEFVCEIESFKYQAMEVFENLGDMDAFQILQKNYELSLQNTYPNLDIALRIFITMPVTTASCERSFSKLKIVKSYLRSSIGQERLTNMSIISIEKDVAKTLNYDDIIDVFANEKARKITL